MITGVGSICDSLFQEYAKANRVDIRHLQAAGVVGDIAYCPVSRVGELQGLRMENGDQSEFYRAVSLDVLKEMSRDPSKRVIVVAQNPPMGNSNKTDVIHAALVGRLCNVLITDDYTADDLRKRFVGLDLTLFSADGGPRMSRSAKPPAVERAVASTNAVRWCSLLSGVWGTYSPFGQTLACCVKRPSQRPEPRSPRAKTPRAPRSRGRMTKSRGRQAPERACEKPVGRGMGLEPTLRGESAAGGREHPR